MGYEPRTQAIYQITERDAIAVKPPETLESMWATDVFSLSKMQACLPKAVFKSLKQTILSDAKLDPSVADVIATAMKDWAMSKGALYYAHVFYPLTNATAEKHDGFISVQSDGTVISEFSGKTLIKGESDGSSFPNGGIRSTFEARGYTAWDVTSPAYVMETDNGVTLCIPTVFVSWTGEALDKKIPLLRSIEAMDKSARKVLKQLGYSDVAPVSSSCGAEQEYFLVDAAFANSRPDLLLKGELTGCMPSGTMDFGVPTLPTFIKDSGDRNRTSPFAFTGNRFEFRAVGSNQSVAGPLIAMNTILADSLNWFSNKLEAELSAGTELESAVCSIIKEIMDEHGAVVFGGDGYSEEWHKMAVEERGLLNLPTTADALPYLKDKSIEELFEKTGVFSPKELESRFEVYAEQYILSIEVEAKLVVDMAKTLIYPAAVKYVTELSAALSGFKELGLNFNLKIAKKSGELTNEIVDLTDRLADALEKEEFGSTEEHMQYFAKTIRPLMDEIRECADTLEGELADELWPLPKYQEMLFIK